MCLCVPSTFHFVVEHLKKLCSFHLVCLPFPGPRGAPPTIPSWCFRVSGAHASSSRTSAINLDAVCLSVSAAAATAWHEEVMSLFPSSINVGAHRCAVVLECSYPVAHILFLFWCWPTVCCLHTERNTQNIHGDANEKTPHNKVFYFQLFLGYAAKYDRCVSQL